MKFLKLSFVVLVSFLLLCSNLKAQDEELKFRITLEEAIDLAKQQSVEAFKVKNMYLAKYWRFRSYKAGLRPELSLSSVVANYDNSLAKRYEKGLEYYVPNQSLYNNVSLDLDQAIPFTGGNISVNSQLSRDQNFIKDTSFYSTRPIITVEIRQPISLYNAMKWQAKLEPLRFEAAKKQHIKDVEALSKETVRYYFSLLSSQVNMEIANNNFANADTLYRIAKGRFEIGTITQDELLDLELSVLNSSINLSKSKMDLQRAQNELNSFLKLEKNLKIECILPNSIPTLKLDFSDVYSAALENSPVLMGYEQRMITEDQSVARAKAAALFNGNLRANFGLVGSSEFLEDVYKNPGRSQFVNLGLNVPILDWGKRKGEYLMSKSDREVTKAEVEQSIVEFEQDLMVQVMEFNLQEDQVAIAMKADSTAWLGYDITKKRFYIDKVDVIKLNAARNSLSSARRSYVNALRSYWTYYFDIRETTLYDFEKNESLEADFERIVQDQRF